MIHLSSLDGLIQHRVELLTNYQNAAYAQKYRRAIEAVRRAERAISAVGALPLTEAAARNLAKLMSYKDEYEVARLYSDTAFLQKLREQFDGEPGQDYRLYFHLAPPLLAARDAKGHLGKRSYGPWMLRAFRVMAKLKPLRGTVFDVFGKSAERRMDRHLAQDYLGLLEEFGATLHAVNLPLAVLLAELPEQIRGYGHVKERAIAAFAARRTELLVRYRALQVQRAVT